MSMNIHSVLQQFATLSPHHAFGDVTDHIACIHLASEDSPITTLRQSDSISLTETEFGTFYAQVRGHDPVRLVTRVVTVREGDRELSIHIPSKLTHKGHKIVQERRLSNDIAERLFGSSSPNDDAVVIRTLFKISFDAPVHVEAEIHPAHHTIKEVAKQIDQVIKNQFEGITQPDLEGLYAARKYFAGSNELVCDTVKAAIQYAEADQETTDFALWLFKFGTKAENAADRFVQFLNTATAAEQKQFWSQEIAQTEKILSLLSTCGSQVEQLYFPRLACEARFFEPRPDDFIAKALARCPNLQKLSLCLMDTDERALATCKNLLELHAEEDAMSFHSLPQAPNLRSLTIKVVESIPEFPWNVLASRYSKLGCLTVSCQYPEFLIKDLAKFLPKTQIKISN